MSSLASLTCSATSGKIVACEKKPIAGFPGSSDKVEGVLPRVLPHGRSVLPLALRFCRAHWSFRHPDQQIWMQGLWVVQAPGEAEATCAALNRGGYVDACATIDSDVLLFGAETAFHTLKPLVYPSHSSACIGRPSGHRASR